ncbi:MAG: hypothetical protein OHK0032_10620 [Thermodesulfovibrionales bacterium]
MADKYQIDIGNDLLIFRTASFKAEKGSVLHSEIYNRELASTFVAALLAVTVMILLAMRYKLQLLHYVIAVAIFIIVFPLCRAYVFREPCLETQFDKASKIVSITLKRLIGSKTIEMPIGSLRDIRISHVRIEPQNPDGIRFIERVALQHGTVIPGFGEAKDLYNVELLFNEEERDVIFTTAIKQEADSVVEEIKRYIEFSGR